MKLVFYALYLQYLLATSGSIVENLRVSRELQPEKPRFDLQMDIHTSETPEAEKTH